MKPVVMSGSVYCAVCSGGLLPDASWLSGTPVHCRHCGAKVEVSARVRDLVHRAERRKKLGPKVDVAVAVVALLATSVMVYGGRAWMDADFLLRFFFLASGCVVGAGVLRLFFPDNFGVLALVGSVLVTGAARLLLHGTSQWLLVGGLTVVGAILLLAVAFGSSGPPRNIRRR